MQSLSDMLKVPGPDVIDRVSGLLAKIKEAERTIAKLNQQQVLAAAGSAVQSAERIGEIVFSGTELGEVSSGDDVRSFVQDVRNRLGSEAAVVAAIGNAGGKPSVVVGLNDAAREAGYKAGDLVKTACQILGGGGGGRPDLAQGGGTDMSKAPEALAALRRELGAA